MQITTSATRVLSPQRSPRSWICGSRNRWLNVDALACAMKLTICTADRSYVTDPRQPCTKHYPTTQQTNFSISDLWGTSSVLLKPALCQLRSISSTNLAAANGFTGFLAADSLTVIPYWPRKTDHISMKIITFGQMVVLAGASTSCHFYNLQEWNRPYCWSASLVSITWHAVCPEGKVWYKTERWTGGREPEIDRASKDSQAKESMLTKEGKKRRLLLNMFLHWQIFRKWRIEQKEACMMPHQPCPSFIPHFDVFRLLSLFFTGRMWDLYRN